MPVIVERIQNPTVEDRTDLTKIYNDAPDWMQTCGLAGQWLTDILTSPESALYGARFNDRLIAAAVVTVSKGHWHLTWLNVRAVTRNRCVGQRVVAELERMAQENNCALTAECVQNADNLPSYLKALM